MSSSTFEEQLALHGKIVYTNVGDSMMPLIKQGRDALIIERPTEAPRKYDVPLYKRPSGQYVLHRIIGKGRDGYRICGDNRISVERGVTEDQIIGILTGIIRDGKEISLSTAGYKLYSFYHADLFFIKVILFKLRAVFEVITGKRRLKKK